MTFSVNSKYKFLFPLSDNFYLVIDKIDNKRNEKKNTTND